MSVWKQLVIVLIVGAFGAGIYDAYLTYFGDDGDQRRRSRNRTVAVEVAQAVQRVLPRTVEAVGTTRARQSIEVVPLASGRVVEIAFEPGQQVKAGDVLVRLDDDIQQADLADALAQLSEKAQAVERAERLRASNSVARATVEQVIAAQAAANASFERAQRRLEDRVIRAPFDGVVGLTDIDLGARVDDKSVLTTLDDLTEVEIEFSLPETLFSEISAGLNIRAYSAAFPGRAFDGRVASIDSRIDQVSRAFKVRAVVPNPEGILPSGMFMSLTLTLEESQALVVPEEAIVVQAAETFVFVVEDEKAQRRNVETGLRRDGVVAIGSGLSPGETVIIRGLQQVRAGSALRIVGAGGKGGGKRNGENQRDGKSGGKRDGKRGQGT